MKKRIAGRPTGPISTGRTIGEQQADIDAQMQKAANRQPDPAPRGPARPHVPRRPTNPR